MTFAAVFVSAFGWMVFAQGPAPDAGAEGEPPSEPLAPVLPGVWRVGGAKWGVEELEVVSAKGDSNVYLLRLPDGLVMVDCATIGSVPAIERNIHRAGFEPDDVTDLILSHSHADHTEAAELWRTRYGLRTHLNEIGAVFMDREDTSLLGYVGEGQHLEYAPFHVDHRVRDGEVFDVAGVTMAATCVPGHTLDSTLFTFEINGRTVGISGDFVFGPANWNKEGGGLGAMRNLWKASLPDYRDSLERVLEMDIDVLLPGHGAAIVGREAVRRNLELALETIERFLDTPQIYVFGMHKPRLEPWLKEDR
jgi:glyoxylase-like metal-dependent hydrolase (beta-lactamase superfamily II)